MRTSWVLMLIVLSGCIALSGMSAASATTRNADVSRPAMPRTGIPLYVQSVMQQKIDCSADFIAFSLSLTEQMLKLPDQYIPPLTVTMCCIYFIEEMKKNNNPFQNGYRIESYAVMFKLLHGFGIHKGTFTLLDILAYQNQLKSAYPQLYEEFYRIHLARYIGTSTAGFVPEKKDVQKPLTDEERQIMNNIRKIQQMARDLMS